MSFFNKLFVKAPFDHLQMHMEKAVQCIQKLPLLFQMIETKNYQDLEKGVEELSQLEHEADTIKNEIRTIIPKGFLFPIDRTLFLEILGIQDNLADNAEDIAKYLVVRHLILYEPLKKPLYDYLHKSMETTLAVREIIHNFNSLVETSFGGPLAQSCRIQIEKVAFNEHECSKMKREITKELFNFDESIKPHDLYLWSRIIDKIGLIAHTAEKLALRIGMLLEYK